MIRKGGFMFGHDKHDDDNDDVIQPVSNKPVNEGLLGVNDDNDDTPATTPTVDDSSNTDLDVDENEDRIHTDQPSDESAADTSTDDLLDIKKQALQELSPLVDHLEQTPEEKFKTTMMMIQATDDKSLVPDAYEAAKGIKDDKVRAQALLDIVNEINYFTQGKKD